MTAVTPDTTDWNRLFRKSLLMAQFLRAELAAFMQADWNAGNGWNTVSVAQTITFDEAIPGQASQDTISRLLRPEFGQDPSQATLTAVGVLLLSRRWMSEEDAARVADAAAASGWSSRLTLDGRQSTADFARSLADEYRGYRLVGKTLFDHRLTVALETGNDDGDAQVLRAAERILVHRLQTPPRVIGQTRCLHPALHHKVAFALRQAGQMEIGHSTAHGSVFVSTELVFLVMQGLGRFPASLQPLSRILFAPGKDGDEVPAGLIGARVPGWSAGAMAEFAPDEAAPDALFARALEDVALFRRPLPKEEGAEGEAGEEETGKPVLGFAAMDTDELDDDALDAIEQAIEANAEETRRIEAWFAGAASPTEKLRVAIDCFEIDHALAAIEASADVNARHPATGAPLVFKAAQWNMAAIIRAMLASGRLDLTLRDRFGNLPSRCVDDDAAMEELLAAEIGQHKARGLDPRPTGASAFGTYAFEG